ncbi:MAG TPA: hypothetical protein VM925_00380, partial [Labilithrix sp.]|nr:hypothetical protein [Labilithrix sp.]
MTDRAGICASATPTAASVGVGVRVGAPPTNDSNRGQPCARWRRWTRPSVASFVLIAHTLTVPKPATAQSQTTDRVLAEALFREGRDLMDQEKIGEACAKFAESYRLDRALGTLLNLAVCHEKEGKTAMAWAEFTEAAAEAAAERDDREAFAKKHAAALATDLPRVRLLVAPLASALSSLVIRLDGSPVGRSVWTSTVPLDPGDHDLTAAAEGKKPFRITFNVPKGAGVTNVQVPALEDAPREPAPGRAGERGSSDSGTTQRVIGYVLGGLGLAGVGVGSVFGLRALSLKN